jgi:FKBP-type peptidyl-prolyl cis-trans isomerase FkpA
MMKKIATAILSVSILGLTACQPPIDPLKVEILPLETEQAKQSYAMGASIGSILQDKVSRHQEVGIEYDKALLIKGFVAALQGQSQIQSEEIQTLARAVEAKVREEQSQRKAKIGEANKAEGLAFLTDNATRDGIVVTDSGLQYEVLSQGSGAKPHASDTVKVNYLGTSLDGTEFDSSYSRGKPATFPLNRVIKGWTEGVQLMEVGAKYKFYVPSELAYGARSTGKIKSHSALIFEVELLEIINTGKTATH